MHIYIRSFFMGSVMCAECKKTQRQQGRHHDTEWRLSKEPIPTDFSQREIDLLSTAWRYSTQGRKATELGFVLFEKLFIHFPDVQKLFFSRTTNDFLSSQEWKDNPLFIVHVRKVLDAIDMSIALLEEPQPLHDYLNSQEVFHRNLQGMKKFYFEIFFNLTDASMSQVTGSAYKGDFKRAFRKLLTFIYYSMTKRLLI